MAESVSTFVSTRVPLWRSKVRLAVRLELGSSADGLLKTMTERLALRHWMSSAPPSPVCAMVYSPAGIWVPATLNSKGTETRNRTVGLGENLGRGG